MREPAASDCDSLVRHLHRMQLGGSGASRMTGRPRTVTANAAPVTTAATSRTTSVAHCQTDIRAMMLQSFRSPASAAVALERPESREPVPGFQLAFGTTASRAAHLLAAVDEEGMLSLIDTRTSVTDALPSTQQQQRHSLRRPPAPARVRWRTHRNAVFDVIWAHDDAQLVTASGDLRVCGWDVATQQHKFTLTGHRMSVKCVRQVPQHDALFATGARDGDVLLWDTRALATGAPVATLHSVHAAAKEPVRTSADRKRKASVVAKTAPRSVTSIAMASNGHAVITAGAGDSIVKWWDIRRIATSHHLRTTAFASAKPVQTLVCVSSPSSSPSAAYHGITSLAFDATYSKLLVSVLNDAIHVVDVRSAATATTTQSRSLVQCRGHVATSFFIKAAWSPDSDFIVSGSADGAAFIWDASSSSSTHESTKLPRVALKAHASDVNSVAWHSNDFTTLATCSDDASVRIWRVDRRLEAAKERFELERDAVGDRWRNWNAFSAQPDGTAYAVALPPVANDTSDDDASIDVDCGSDTPAKRRLDVVDNRNRLLQSPALPPARRRSTAASQTPQTTLLDYWRP